MQTIRTDKGKTYEVDACARSFDGRITVLMDDDRILSVIAPEFEGIEHFEYYEGSELLKEYNGYSELSAVIRTDIHNKVQISVKKPDGGD